MPILSNSCANNLKAYGVSTTTILSLLHCLHCIILFFFDGLYTDNTPHLLHTAHLYLSDRSIMLSFINKDVPWLNTLSRSISPMRRPPPFLLPAVGCRVNITLGNSFLSLSCPLTLILSATMCFNLK